MTDLSHDNDVATHMKHLCDANNEVVRLTNELISAGGILNDARGKFAEIKARIKAEKEKINTLKVLIRAENSTSGGF